MRSFSEKFAGLIGLSLLALIYLVTFPLTVQTGDTGELVTNAFFLRVSHPPGYPLYTLLYHLPEKFLTWLSPFGTAGFVTVILSLIWIGILLRTCKTLEQKLSIIVLGTTMLVWRYAVLPDVFALHLLFLVLVYTVFQEPSLLKRPWIIFLIALSVANHHTIVFAFPLFAYAWFQGDRKNVLSWSLLAGVFAFSLYFTLLCFHPDNLYSWGHIHSVGDILHHFLRTDYGTFQLTHHQGKPFSSITLLLEFLVTDLWSVVIFVSFVLWKNGAPEGEKRIKAIILAASILIYLFVFMVLGTIALNLTGELVFERFLLQPVLLLVFLALLFGAEIKTPHWISLLLVLNVGTNIWKNFAKNDFRKNTLIEDWATNVLESLPPQSIFLPKGDTEGFATYYVHEALGKRKDVIVFHPLENLTWFYEKLEKLRPDVFQSKSKDLFENLNLKHFDLYSNALNTVLPLGVKLSQFGVLYKYEKVSEEEPGYDFDCDVVKKYKWRFHPELEDFAHFDYGHFLWLAQGNCYANKALLALKNEDNDGALENFEKGLEVAPFSARILERICYLRGQLNRVNSEECQSQLDQILEVESLQYVFQKN